MPIGPKSYREPPTSPEVEFSRYLQQLEARIANLETKAPNFPVLEVDPPDSSNINWWMFPDGRIRTRFRSNSVEPVTYTIMEYAPVSTPGPPNNTVSPLPDQPVPPISRVSTYEAVWSAGYKQDASLRSDIPEYLPFGYNSQSGRNRSLIGFDYAQIQTDLSGSTVTNISLRLQMLNVMSSRDVQVGIGIHNSSVMPSTWPVGTLPKSQLVIGTFYQNQYSEIDLTLEFVDFFRAGTGKGIALEAPNDSVSYSGLAAGVGAPYFSPELIVEYVK